MNTLVVWILGIIVALTVIFITGLYDTGLNYLLRYLFHRHKRLRRHQRPSRVFLIRHGQSQANVDTSN